MGSKVKVTRHKNGAGVGVCNLVSAGFFCSYQIVWHVRRWQLKKNSKLVALDKYLQKKGSRQSSPTLSPTSATSEDVVCLVLRDMLSMRLANGGLGYKSRMMFILPDCLRLKSEVSVVYTKRTWLGACLHCQHRGQRSQDNRDIVCPVRQR